MMNPLMLYTLALVILFGVVGQLFVAVPNFLYILFLYNYTKVK